MDRVHHGQRVSPADDAQEILDGAVANRSARESGLGAPAGWDVSFGDRHRENVAADPKAGKSPACSLGVLPDTTAPSTFPSHSPARTLSRSSLILLVVVAVACGGERRAERSNTLVAALTSDPGQLNPAITTNGGVHTASSLLYDGLLSLDDSLRPQPALAERWEVEDGGARYRFHLRRGARWHDGQPFTSADVKFTFDSLLLQFHARTRASVAPALASIETPDDSTVEFRFRHPYAPFLQQLDVGEAPMMPRHRFANAGDPLRNAANTAPVGTGPYRFVSYQANSEIRYAANSDYFGGPPAIQNVVMRIVPDEGTQVIALEAGEVDWLFGVPGPERKRVANDPRFALLRTSRSPGGSNCVSTLGFNLDRPMFRDVRVRHAIAYAVDRQQFLERVLFGDGRIATAPISSGIAFAHASDLTLPSYDTARAAQLLDSAGWHRTSNGTRTARGVNGVADGTPLAFSFRGLPAQMSYGDLLRAQLRLVGIDVRVEPLEQVVFSRTVFTARDFDTAIASYCNGPDPEIGVRRQLVSSSVAPVPFSNMAGYRNRIVDSLFDRAGATVAIDERRALYHQIQEIVVRDQPYIWLVETVQTLAHTARCRGFREPAHFAATATCTR
jgi:peptide/nickel transport system substrate-binding protein